MKVLITGGAGYIGSHCNKCLHEKGIDTIIVDDLSSGHKEAVKWGKFYQLDFASDQVFSILKKESIEAVIHFAAFADVADSMVAPGKYYKNNVEKTYLLLSMMKEGNVKKIVFSSSAAIFGEPKYVPIDEAHQKKPINPYGTTKLINELLLEDYMNCFGFQFASLRYFNACGADKEGVIGESHTPEHHLIPRIMQAMIDKKKKFNIFGNDYNTPDKTAIRDYIHVTDLAEVHWLALKHIIDIDESLYLNLGNNIGYSVLEVFSEAAQTCGINIGFEYKDRRPGDPAVLIASNEKAKKILNWTPKNSDMRNIISTAWNWETNRRF